MREISAVILRGLLLLLAIAVPGIIQGQASTSPQNDLKTLDIAVLRQKAQAGDAAAETEIGDRYFYGRGGVVSDHAQAFLWFRKAAAQGWAEAEFMVGFLYEGAGGNAVPMDVAQARSWYQKAAGQGNSNAEFFLGFLCSQGVAGPKDYLQAFAWFQKAAAQGHQGAQQSLGDMYRKGQGVPKDYAQALAWYRKAADGVPNPQYSIGGVEAETSLGEMYKNGEGVPQDQAQANAWFQKAADQGWGPAKLALGQIKALPMIQVESTISTVPLITAEEQSSLAAKHPEWPVLDHSPDLPKAKKYLDAGIEAFNQGKYVEVTAQLGKSLKLLPESDNLRTTWRRYALIFLGDSLEKRGDFDGAYDAYIVSCNISRAPPAAGLPEEKAAQAAGCLIESRKLRGYQWVAEEVVLAQSSDLGLAGILQHFGRATDAQPLEEEARIHKEATEAAHPYPSYQGKAQAIAVVYERENRPDLAHVVRDQITRVEEENAQSEDNSSENQSTPSTLQMILQGLSGVAAAKGGTLPQSQGGQASSNGSESCLQHLGETCEDLPGYTPAMHNCVQTRDPKNPNLCICVDKSTGKLCERVN